MLKNTNKRIGFTLAEILLSLTIIGVVAAIALPSLLGNANERAWETQKKALYTRFSQALPLLPSLNGYGELVGNLSDCGNSCLPDDDLKDTAAETFLRDGLSKVMKITNICDNDHLTDCGLPSKIIPINGGSAIELDSIKYFTDFNTTFKKRTANDGTVHEQLDTKAAAFETTNGESILLYYYPNCQANLGEDETMEWYYVQKKVCANFVYDLNGKKGPNTVGKDIGFITALYSTNPSIATANPYSSSASITNYEEAFTICKNLDENAKVPNIDELTSMYVNESLLGFQPGNNVFYISSNSLNSTQALRQHFDGHRGRVLKANSGYKVWCTKR